MRHYKALPLACGLLTLTCTSLLGQTAPYSGDIIREREKARGRVEFVHKHFLVSVTDYDEAKELYTDLRAEYQDLIKTLADGIESGEIKKLRKSPEVRKKCAGADQAARQFVDYVKRLMERLKASRNPLGGFLMEGNDKPKLEKIKDAQTVIENTINILIKIKGKRQQDDVEARARRHQEAEAFKADTNWPRWEEIVTLR